MNREEALRRLYNDLIDSLDHWAIYCAEIFNQRAYTWADLYSSSPFIPDAKEIRDFTIDLLAKAIEQHITDPSRTFSVIESGRIRVEISNGDDECFGRIMFIPEDVEKEVKFDKDPDCKDLDERFSSLIGK
jgi:hypothetical protein